MQSVIQTFSLTKRFASSRSYRALLRFRREQDLIAVDQVTLEVQEGELFGLLGPNGAGKTTLIKMLCTLILPSEGRASVCGRDVVAEEAAVRRMVGVVDCQERSFFWRLSGRENLHFFAALHGLHGAPAERRIRELLDLVGLADQRDQRFMGYSSGMRQKLAIARGLLIMPRVLFMDEPTRGLDPVIARDLRRFIRETLVDQLGCTVVLVTHRLEEAEELCDRVAIMNRGRILACGPVPEIVHRIPVRHQVHMQVENLTPDAVDALHNVPGVVQVRWSPRQPCRLDLELSQASEQETLPAAMGTILSQGGRVQRYHVAGLSLEEAFVHLVRDGEDGIEGAGLSAT